MIVAGLGFRSAATAQDLLAALSLWPQRPDLLATATRKASAPAFADLARQLDLPAIGVDVAGVTTPTTSSRVEDAFFTGSLSEAAALMAAGQGAQLIQTRLVTPNGMATIAIAEGPGL